MEKRVEELNTANMYLNKRIGTDNISDSDESDSALSDDEETHKIVINTRHEEYDLQFASSYPFKTNVMILSIYEYIVITQLIYLSSSYISCSPSRFGVTDFI